MSVAPPKWLSDTVFPERIINAIRTDLRGFKSEQCRKPPEIYLLGGRARETFTVIEFCQPLCRTTGTLSPLWGYVIKSPHRPLTEPRDSARASTLHLGPRVVLSDEETIIEEFFPRAWLATEFRGQHSFRGASCARMFLKMLQANFFHRFVALPEHLYIVQHGNAVEARMIDWAKTDYLPDKDEEYEFFIETKLGALRDYVSCGSHGKQCHASDGIGKAGPVS